MIKDWEPLFKSISNKEYAKSLKLFLDKEYKTKTIYPPRDMVFQAFKLTKPSTLKVVIIGQDPYHNPGQAMGLSFSVPRGINPPPSLINVYKEIQDDLSIKMDFDNGDLTPWAEQGILLLNAYLTVEANKPLSHKMAEYDSFINDVMVYLDSLDQPLVFMLWGSFAKQYLPLIHNPKHIALTSSHPSPMAANFGGWFGKHLFSKCNDFLLENNVSPIDWQIK
jgi:uracil-DNA glycosylase